jgi:hypothetical protein
MPSRALTTRERWGDRFTRAGEGLERAGKFRSALSDDDEDELQRFGGNYGQRRIPSSNPRGVNWEKVAKFAKVVGSMLAGGGG